MSRVALLLVLPVMLACSKKEAPPADTMAVVTEAAAPNVAGKWTVNVMPEGQDTVLLTYVLDATNDMTGWKLTFPGRDPLDVRVISMDNDSIVIENGPYPSALQQGVMVTTHSNMRLDGDKVVGTTIARYDVKTADSVRMLRTEGTRQ